MTNNRQLDLGSLTLYDYNTVTTGRNDTETTQHITNQLVNNLQFILSSLVEEKQKQIAAVAVLPEEQQIHDFQKSKLFLKFPQGTTVFPRSRKIPDVKRQTKWQRFAKDKGIKKRKKGGMNYDPNLKMQVSRWGKNSKKNMIDVPIMDQKQFNRNPFQDARTQKKLRVAKNTLKQTKNRAAAIKYKKK